MLPVFARAQRTERKKKKGFRNEWEPLLSMWRE